ncbi:hypothetical protein EJ04DRAFT_518495 [Polyplosphaeria fusca]|uniref:Uncharacterized protein n=1 Tax=Polyplosphaeria fusca TaxID=682080 RepID=A0A9P4V5J0_9PLEO|nr:hypothetical protein EJ04DRAFT_518495 [Polyplosphaeria fusca]
MGVYTRRCGSSAGPPCPALPSPTLPCGDTTKVADVAVPVVGHFTAVHAESYRREATLNPSPRQQPAQSRASARARSEIAPALLPSDMQQCLDSAARRPTAAFSSVVQV